jgi:hypothetical protein
VAGVALLAAHIVNAEGYQFCFCRFVGIFIIHKFIIAMDATFFYVSSTFFSGNMQKKY